MVFFLREIAHLHSVDEHAREAKGDFLGKFLANHGHFEAVAEVDVNDLAADAVQHEVGRVAVTQPQHVPHHAHDCQRSRVVGTPIEPNLRTGTLVPEDLCEVVTFGVLKRMLEHLHLLHQRQVIILRRHLSRNNDCKT